jgi:hypothetical protein
LRESPCISLAWSQTGCLRHRDNKDDYNDDGGGCSMADSMLPLIANRCYPHCSRHPLPVPAISSPADQSPGPNGHGMQVRIVVVTPLNAQQLGKGGIVGGGPDGVLLPPRQGRRRSRRQGSRRPCRASSAASLPAWHDRLPPQPPGTTIVADLLPPPPPSLPPRHGPTGTPSRPRSNSIRPMATQRRRNLGHM